MTSNKPAKPSYTYRFGQDEFGPFSSRQLREEMKAGRLTPDCEIQLPGSSKWVSALTVTGLFETPLGSHPTTSKLDSDSPTKKGETDKGLFGLTKKQDRWLAGIGFGLLFGVVGIYMIFNTDFRRDVFFLDKHPEFQLTTKENREFTSIVRKSVAGALSHPDDSEIGLLFWENIDDSPNGNMRRYVIDDRVKATNSFGAILTLRLFARATVTIEDERRTAKLEFVKLDGETVYLDSSFTE